MPSLSDFTTWGYCPGMTPFQPFYLCTHITPLPQPQPLFLALWSFLHRLTPEEKMAPEVP